MSDPITAEDAWKLLDEVAQNQPRVCLAWCLKSAEDCLCYKAKIAEGALYSAAPDLARTVIALHADRERFSQGIRRLTAENNRLRDALKPFADEAEYWETWVADESLVEWFPEYDGNENPITVGDLRNARAALKGDRNE